MSRLALDILHTLLISHELCAEDFSEEQRVKLPQGDTVQVPRPPGFTILEHMLSDSTLLKKVSENAAMIVWVCMCECVVYVCVYICACVHVCSLYLINSSGCVKHPFSFPLDHMFYMSCVLAHICRWLALKKKKPAFSRNYSSTSTYAQVMELVLF